MVDNISVILFAAGRGTRLSGGQPSPKPKVLYPLAGRPIISYTIETLKKVGFKEIIVVVGYKANEVKKALGTDFIYAYQRQQLGTGDALRVGLSKVTGKVVIALNGDDSAFYKPDTFFLLIDKHLREKNTITFVSLVVDNPFGLGRVLRRNGKVVAIVEEKIATKEQKAINEINDGLYIFDSGWVKRSIRKIKKSAVGEYYIGDLISLAAEEGKRVGTFALADRDQWQGINTIAELELADRKMKRILGRVS